MSRRRTNKWERFSTILAAKAKALSTELATQMMGTDPPPGYSPIPKSEQLRRYLLLAQPRMTLSPQHQEEADKLWMDYYAEKSPEELKEWALSMTKEYLRLTKPAMDSMPSMDSPEEVSDDDIEGNDIVEEL